VRSPLTCAIFLSIDIGVSSFSLYIVTTFSSEVKAATVLIFPTASEDKVVAMYKDKLETPMSIERKMAHVSGLLTGLSQMCLFCTYTLDFWYGGKLIADGELSFVELMKVFMAILLTAMSIGQSTAMAPNVAKAKPAASALFQMIDEIPEIDSESTVGDILNSVTGNIEFKQVEFFYATRPDATVFDALNLTVAPGKVMALVGQSGCGKSSIISLLERFYNPVEGEILLDGVEIRKINLKSLRQQIGLVGQEPVLFAGTIADNIRYGKPDATQEEIEAAARDSNAHDFVSHFPDKYETFCGEKGTQLSGGQKQRIAIARAIIKNPKILLLDEATSALDTESEKIVQEALDRVMKGRTTIVVAHRLTTIKHADIIAVVDDCKIAEEGTHDELMKFNGIYANLVMAQTV